MKVFISYATEDVQTATSVFQEMEGAGAEVFQFGRSEVVGKPSWPQVLTWISQSDVFVVLISKHSLNSKPVKEEIDHAHYSYINRGKPEKLVPAVIEAGALPPILIERFTQIDFTSLDAGLDRLLKQLKLVRRAKRAAASLYLSGLQDFGPLFTEFKRKHPDPLPASEFSAQAEKIVSNYSKVAPKEIGHADRKQHLDGILAGLSGKKYDFKGLSKYNDLFFGLDPNTKLNTPDPGITAPKLAATLASFDPADWKSRLDTPIASVKNCTIAWAAIPGAVSYEVQQSPLNSLAVGEAVYRGTATEYWTIPITETHFRVKAVGGVFRRDSLWSLPVTLAAPTFPSLISNAPLKSPFTDLAKPKFQPPKLESSGSKWFVALKWSRAAFITKYVLEGSDNVLFRNSTPVYEGPGTEWSSLGVPKRFYRVKGVSALDTDTGWSNTVEC